MDGWVCWRPALLTMMSSPPRPLHGLVDQAGAEGFVAEVAGDGKGDAAFLLDEGDDFLRVRLFGGEVVDGDVGAFARIGDGGGAAHAGVAAGDEGLAAGEAAGAAVAGLAVVGTGVHLAGEAGPGLRLPLEGRAGILGRGVLEGAAAAGLRPGGAGRPGPRRAGGGGGGRRPGLGRRCRPCVRRETGGGGAGCGCGGVVVALMGLLQGRRIALMAARRRMLRAERTGGTPRRRHRHRGDTIAAAGALAWRVAPIRLHGQGRRGRKCGSVGGSEAWTGDGPTAPAPARPSRCGQDWAIRGTDLHRPIRHRPRHLPQRIRLGPGAALLVPLRHVLDAAAGDVDRAVRALRQAVGPAQALVLRHSFHGAVGAAELEGVVLWACDQEGCPWRPSTARPRRWWCPPSSPPRPGGPGTPWGWSGCRWAGDRASARQRLPVQEPALRVQGDAVGGELDLRARPGGAAAARRCGR